MRKITLSICICMLCVGTFFVQSCNQNDDSMQPSLELTNADIVISSPEYQVYSKALREHSLKMISALKKLSKDKRKEVLYMLKNGDKTLDNLDKISVILNYDINAGYLRVLKKYEAVHMPEDLSQREFVRALYRNGQANGLKKSRTTDSEESSDKYFDCLEKCENNILISGQKHCIETYNDDYLEYKENIDNADYPVAENNFCKCIGVINSMHADCVASCSASLF